MLKHNDKLINCKDISSFVFIEEHAGLEKSLKQPSFGGVVVSVIDFTIWGTWGTKRGTS